MMISGTPLSNNLSTKTSKLAANANTNASVAAEVTPLDTMAAGHAGTDNAMSGVMSSALHLATAINNATQDPTQGAQEIPGLFKILRKGDKVWFSISAEQLNKPFFFSSNVSKSVGERGLVGSEMGWAQLAEFRRAGNQIQLVAKNTENFAEEGSPQSKFVEEDYADSLIASAPVLAAGQNSGQLMFEANALLFNDIPGYQARLQRVYDTPFGLDVKNTSFSAVDNSDEQTSFGVQAHFQAPAVPPRGGSLPSTTPDGRSLLTEFRYNFLKLPDSPMAPRLADDRIGHFVTTRKDYTGDEGDGKVRYVNRWRLEKKDPDAPLSEPKQPITYWIANDVPEKYRESVKEGILEWNKAFERIGYKDAIQVRQQTENDKFDTLDARHASVRWYTAADVGSAVGPSQVDPRSGEILDADIRMADVFGRSAQRFLLDNPPSSAAPVNEEEVHVHQHDDGDDQCSYLAHAGAEQQFAQSLLEARGDKEASQKLANAYIKDVVMHEVGHTLGLRHNFLGSTVFTPEQLQDAEFTKQNGLGSSVMDYHPFNLASPGEKQGEYVMSTLGAYDYLAIEYAYAPLDPAKEKEELDAIALQTTTDPHLAYESDEAADASDPDVNRFDLGNDPLEFAKKQAQLGRELWDRAQNRVLPAGASYQELSRAFSAGLNKLAGSVRYMARYIGGVKLRRDHAGTGNPVHQPVPAEKQREALNAITGMLFQPDSFKFKPEFVSHLGKDRFESWGDQNVHVGQSVLRLQTNALHSLLAGDVAQRIIENPNKQAEGEPVFRLSELYDSLQSNIWSELPKSAEINQGRRDLQREYIKAVLPFLAPDSKAPGEASSLMRYEAGQLKKQIDEALKGQLSLESRAHLDQCSQTLARALDGDTE
jgi:hypothetical protein